MTKHEFLNRLKSLSFIDRDQLPELPAFERAKFLSDPARYFIRCSDAQADAIWREIEKCQPVKGCSDMNHRTLAEIADEFDKAATHYNDLADAADTSGIRAYRKGVAEGWTFAAGRIRDEAAKLAGGLGEK